MRTMCTRRYHECRDRSCRALTNWIYSSHGALIITYFCKPRIRSSTGWTVTSENGIREPRTIGAERPNWGGLDVELSSIGRIITCLRYFHAISRNATPSFLGGHSVLRTECGDSAHRQDLVHAIVPAIQRSPGDITLQSSYQSALSPPVSNRYRLPTKRGLWEYNTRKVVYRRICPFPRRMCNADMCGRLTARNTQT